MFRKETSILKPYASQEAIFEQLYSGLRQQERRVYTDEELQLLPDIAPRHVHEREWRIRRRSSGRLFRYLSGKRRALNILDIGCGNGWMAARLAGIPQACVRAIDISDTEISQAARVFRRENLRFMTGVFDPAMFGKMEFDIVVFAASLQYFPRLQDILQQVQQCMATKGEIHILDTPFYSAATVGDARERARRYFAEQGYPGMSDHYFHHLLEELEGFKYRPLFNPRRLYNRLRYKDPFYWICIHR